MERIAALTLSIGDVAGILNVTTTTIRNWEKYGLITPKRRKNGYRYFEVDDIARLREIKRCMVDEHLNVKIVKAIPQIKNSQDQDLQMYWRQNVRSVRGSSTAAYFSSTKWKKIRVSRGLTLEDVGNAVGLSPSYLSKIENGLATLSYDIAEKLASYYGENLFFFTSTPKRASTVIHEGEGREVDCGFLGTQSKILSTIGSDNLFPTLFTVQPRCGSLEPHSHSGEEFVYCLSGKISITLNHSDTYVLKAGDSFHFRASDIHFWRNPSNKISKILWVYCSAFDLNSKEAPADHIGL